MGNLMYVSSKKNLENEAVTTTLEAINERRFNKFFTIENVHDGGWEIGYLDDEGDHQSSWYLSVDTPRRLGAKRPFPRLQWLNWAWGVFFAELGHSWKGRLSDEGVPGTWDPQESLNTHQDFLRYLTSYYAHFKDDDPVAQEILETELDAVKRTMPKRLYPYAFPTTAGKMQQHVHDAFAKLGVEVSFETDTDLKKFRPGELLTLGELRKKKEGEVVWVCTRDEDGSTVGDGAYRLELRDDGWFFDDGSSFACDFYSDEDDSAAACDEYISIYEAIPDRDGERIQEIHQNMQALVDEFGRTQDLKIADELARLRTELAKLKYG